MHNEKRSATGRITTLENLSFCVQVLKLPQNDKTKAYHYKTLSCKLWMDDIDICKGS